MNKKVGIGILIAVVVSALCAVLYFLQPNQVFQQVNPQSRVHLVRDYSPSTGSPNAKVTIVEFFDPACGACKNFYPIVKEALKNNPTDVRLVLRYAPFHKGSNDVVKFIQASKNQNKYWEVLEAVLDAQSSWADHKNGPKMDVLYQVAEKTGLDVQKAIFDAKSADVANAIAQDEVDLNALEILRTPSFIINNSILNVLGKNEFNKLLAHELSADPSQKKQ